MLNSWPIIFSIHIMKINPEERDIEIEGEVHVFDIEVNNQLLRVGFQDEVGNTSAFFNVEDGRPEHTVPALKFGYEHGILEDVANLLDKHGVTIPGVSDLRNPEELKQLGLFDDQEP